METSTLPVSKLTKRQTKDKTVFYREGDTDYRMKITLRYDDQCGNGHNTFSITSWIDEKRGNGHWREYGGGANHDEIVKRAPEFAPLIRWHLCSSDGPLHYVSNSLYLAGDKDCWGKRKGEPRSYETRIFFDSVPIPFTGYKENFYKWLETIGLPHGAKGLEIIEFPYVGKDNYKFDPHYSFTGFGSSWYDAPFRSKEEAKNFLEAIQTCATFFQKVPTAWGEGKEPQLDAARSTAIWPDAALEDFTEEKLLARLPGLMQDFKTAMEGLGFTY